ncbi:hypothetical protein [Halocatena pleomorpha]|uniref:Uncharacterized protein n=1 Tax=Halocatena pleomorpha TaxID=1785090 RepID=A0A3P3R508_9EURY|nr:hypothetical protein [Halocatena pleomorpha]RRJ28038.1 hypothetical protein EIK79_16775 [Halocatena pleomorpha]
MSSDFRTYTRAGTNRLQRFGEELSTALSYPFLSGGRVVLTTVVAGLTFFVLVLFAQSMGVINMVLNNPQLVTVDYFKSIFLINIEQIGTISIAMNVAYAMLTGIAITNMVAQLRMFQVGSVANISAVIPGLFAAGCASCGPGLFAIFGLTGAVSFIPFQQTVLRVAGIALFLLFLGFAGDPRECRID